MSLEVLLKVIMIDLILSGDNAILIALAAKNVPKEHQKKVIMWGTVGAITLRLLFASIIVWLLKVPFLAAIGGLLLIKISYNLLAHNKDHSDVNGGTTVISAIKTVIIADALMSLDNVLALAGVAHDFMPIMIGILISVPIIVWGSSFIMKAMEKYPIIVYFGAGILAWTSGEMIVGDPRISSFLHGDIYHYGIPATIAVLVLLFGFLNRKKKNS
jgi:YjbE family integral membrane protein